MLSACSPPGPRRIFSGTAKSTPFPNPREDFDAFIPWLYAPDQPPQGVSREDEEGRWRIVERSTSPFLAWNTLVEDGLVYESIGGGFILVKEFAGGAGLADIFPPSEP